MDTSETKNRVVGNAIDNILQTKDPAQKPAGKPKKTAPSDREELELAVAVILVDVASSDGSFEPPEYEMISEGLKQLFNSSKDRVKSLVNQSQQILAGLRGTSHYTALLRESMSEEDRKAVFSVVENLVEADGKVDPFEIYMKNKLAAALGIAS